MPVQYCSECSYMEITITVGIPESLRVLSHTCETNFTPLELKTPEGQSTSFSTGDLVDEANQ